MAASLDRFLPRARFIERTSPPLLAKELQVGGSAELVVSVSS